MIFGAIQFKGNAAQLADRSAQVIIKTHFIVGRNEWPAILRGEDYVIKEIRVGVGHVLSLARVSRNVFCMTRSIAHAGSINLLASDPGAYAPGFMLSRAPRAISNQVGFCLGYGFAGRFKISASAFNRFASAAFFALVASFSNAGAIFFRFPVSPF